MKTKHPTLPDNLRQRVQDRRDAITKILQDCEKTTAQIQELEKICERWQAEHAAAQETVAYTDTGKVRAMEDKHAQLRLARTRLARLNESLEPEAELLKPALHELNFLIIEACEPFLAAFRQAAIQGLLPFSSNEYAARKLVEQTDLVNCYTHFTRQTYDSYPPLHRAAARALVILDKILAGTDPFEFRSAAESPTGTAAETPEEPETEPADEPSLEGQEAAATAS